MVHNIPDVESTDYPYIKMPEKEAWIGKKGFLEFVAVLKELWQRIKK